MRDNEPATIDLYKLNASQIARCVSDALYNRNVWIVIITNVMIFFNDLTKRWNTNN